jgi:hypothetical protein
MNTAAGVDGGALAARAVLDLERRSRLLGSLWRHQPAVVVWLRHFG